MQPPRNTGPKKLTESVLTNLDPRVEVPRYDRHQLGRGWVHFGVGHFSRSHSAVYLHDLAQRGEGQANGWGICGVGVGLLPGDRKMLEALGPQQGLYTVVTRSAEENRARVVGSLTAFMLAPDDPGAVLSALADKRTHIVSLTITESGYNVNDAANTSITRDSENPYQPPNVFAYICEALDQRRRAKIRPFTVLSLDNIQGNGDVARQAVLNFLGRRDGAIRAWIESEAHFPNSMVDRITPGTTDDDREMVAREFGIADAWPVMTEEFRQWVIEDTFSDGRPPLEEVGVLFPPGGVQSYERMKLRLLNASHSAMGYLGYLVGHRFVHDVMGDNVFKWFIDRMMNDEIKQHVHAPPDFDLDRYERTLIERFSNPHMKDLLERVCKDGSGKMPKFILPSIIDALETKRPHRLLTLAVAGWIRYMRGVDAKGGEIKIEDPMADTLRKLAPERGGDLLPLLSLRTIFDDRLTQDKAWVQSLAKALLSIDEHGVKSTLSTYVGNPDA